MTWKKPGLHASGAGLFLLVYQRPRTGAERRAPPPALAPPPQPPPIYLSQLAQYMDGQNVRVWKESTAAEIIDALLVIARYVQPDIETARTLTAGLHDMVYLYPAAVGQIEGAAKQGAYPDAGTIAGTALRLVWKR